MTKRRAYTLTELLVIAALFSSLLLLLLPAVLRSRDAAQRITCRNNLRNQAVALIAFHDAKHVFPAGVDARQHFIHSWSSYILPFLEASDTHNRIRFDRVWNDVSGNATNSHVVIPVYRCPSSRIDFPGDIDFGGIQGTLQSPGSRWESATRGGILIRVDAKFPDAVKQRHVKDGMSHTLVVGEVADRLNDEHGMWADGLNSFSQNNGGINLHPGELSSLQFGDVHVAYADTHVDFLSDSVDDEIVGAICTKDGGDNDRGTDGLN